MKKVLIGLTVAGLLVGGALAVYLITPSDTPPVAEGGKAGGKKKPGSTGSTEGGGDGSISLSGGKAGEPGQDGAKSEIDPARAGQYREPNKAELEYEARKVRPYNKHVAYVGSWWGRAAQILLTSNPELSKEIQELASYMRDMSKLNGDDLKVDEVLAREEQTLQKLQSAASDPELKAIAGYLAESIRVTREGGDPTAVPKPAI